MQFDQIIHLSHQEFFWGKWLILFVDLLCSIMLLNTSKRLFEYIMILKVGEIWENLALTYSVTLKDEFSRKINDYHLCLSSKSHHPKKFQTNHSSWSLDIQGCIILAQIGSKLSIFPIRDFLTKLTVTIVYLNYSFMLQHFKKILKEQIMGQKVA